MQENAAAAERGIAQNGRSINDARFLQTNVQALISQEILAGVDGGCACAALRRASRCVTQLYDLVLAPCGLKCTQFISLRAIDDAGEIAQYQFARQYAVAVETLSRRLGALRRKALVKVRTGTRHGEQIYSLTEEGKKLLNEARPYWERAQERLKTVLGEADWNLLFSITDRAADAALQAEKLRLRNSDHNKTAA
jgi:DNA-binding MarR family transcriptional regulator